MKASFGNYFLFTLTVGQHQSLCFSENKGILFPPLLFFLTFFFPFFLSNQLSADHPSHFSLCPRILWTIVLIPSVLSIKALVILLGTAGRCGSTHRQLLLQDCLATITLSLCLFQAPACKCLSWGPPGLQGRMSWRNKLNNVSRHTGWGENTLLSHLCARQHLQGISQTNDSSTDKLQTPTMPLSNREEASSVNQMASIPLFYSQKCCSALSLA